MIERNRVYNADCMLGMAEMPDNFIDLAIVDPPYGIGENARRTKLRTKLAETTDWGAFDEQWDRDCPDEKFFDELWRVSRNVILWGANHMMHRIRKKASCWIVWDKDNSGCFSDAELAFTTFPTAVRIFKYRWNGMIQKKMGNKEKRIHPTQKPVDLYKWLLQNYAKEGDLILDTHVGSGSSIIACIDMGFDYIGYEIDADYYAAMQDRIYHFTRQGSLDLQ